MLGAVIHFIYNILSWIEVILAYFSKGREWAKIKADFRAPIQAEQLLTSWDISNRIKQGPRWLRAVPNTFAGI